MTSSKLQLANFLLTRIQISACKASRYNYAINNYVVKWTGKIKLKQ